MNLLKTHINTFKGKKGIKDSPKFKKILVLWLQFVKNNLKDSSYAVYYQHVTSYIIPSLGEYYIEEITTEKVKLEIRRLLESGRLRDSGGLSPKMVSDIVSILKRAIIWCRDEGYQIPCDSVKLSVKKPIKKMRVLNRVEQMQLQKTLISKIDGFKLGVLCSLYTGIRIGELCALQWENVDLEVGVLHIRKTLQRIKDVSETGSKNKKTKISISSPKSSDSIRDIPIPSILLTYLRECQSEPKHYLLTGNNKYAEPRIVQYRFKKYLRESQIEDINFHALRHTFATRCVECGVDLKCLSEILGHANVDITLNKYVHTSFELKKENIEKLSLL